MSAFEQTNKTKPQVDLRPPQTGRYPHMHIPHEDTSTYVAHTENKAGLEASNYVSFCTVLGGARLRKWLGRRTQSWQGWTGFTGSILGLPHVVGAATHLLGHTEGQFVPT